jgi:hypothetical protein
MDLGPDGQRAIDGNTRLSLLAYFSRPQKPRIALAICRRDDDVCPHWSGKLFRDLPDLLSKDLAEY